MTRGVNWMEAKGIRGDTLVIPFRLFSTASFVAKSLVGFLAREQRFRLRKIILERRRGVNDYFCSRGDFCVAI